MLERPELERDGIRGDVEHPASVAAAPVGAVPILRGGERRVQLVAAHRRARRGSRAGLVVLMDARRREVDIDERRAATRGGLAVADAGGRGPAGQPRGGGAPAPAPPLLPRGAAARRPADAGSQRLERGPASELAADDRIGVKRRTRDAANETPNAVPSGRPADCRRRRRPRTPGHRRRTSCRRPGGGRRPPPSSDTPCRPAGFRVRGDHDSLVVVGETAGSRTCRERTLGQLDAARGRIARDLEGRLVDGLEGGDRRWPDAPRRCVRRERRAIRSRSRWRRGSHDPAQDPRGAGRAGDEWPVSPRGRCTRRRRSSDIRVGAAHPPVRPDIGERALAQVGRRRGADDVADERDRLRQPAQLLGAGVAAREVTDDGGRHGGIAGHEPIEPAGSRPPARSARERRRGPSISVSGQRSGPASSAGAR